MYRFLPLIFCLLVLPLRASGQELKPEVLDKLKAATVYVIVEQGRVRGTGSGFLFLKRGTTGYIMTCEHVVGSSKTVTVVFRSGTNQERSAEAQVVATDPSRDIACLAIRDFAGLPPVLDLGRKTDVRETETVIAAGFPFGQMFSGGKKYPEINISKSSVTSIRRNESGDVTAVQISGEVNPGNSGGPLVTMDGRVVGVTAAKILGTQTAFAVPSEEIQGFLQGRVKASTFRKLEATPSKAKYEIVLELVDPLGTLKGAGIAWINETEIKSELSPDKDGTWKKVHASMQSVDFEISDDVAKKTLEFAQPSAGAGLAIVYQCYYLRSDGKRIWTEPATKDIDFTAGEDRGVGRRPPPAPPGPAKDEPESPPAAEPPSGPLVELTLPDTLKLATELPVQSFFAALHMAPDGSALYALDLSEGQVYKLDPDTLQVKAKVDVLESAVAMAMSPDGKVLYVGGRLPMIIGADSREQRGPAGNLQLINTSTFTTTSTMDIKAAVIDLVATDGGMVVITRQAQWEGMLIVEPAKKSEEFVQSIYGGGTIRLSRDQRRVYVGDRGLSPGDFRCVPLRREQGKYQTYDSMYHGDHPLGGTFELSADGRFLVAATGSVLRLGRTKEADLRYVTRIDAFQTAALSPSSNTLVTFSADGFAKSYLLGGFELQKSVKLGLRCERAILDAKRKRIHGIFGEVADPRSHDRTPRLGRVASISLDTR